MKFTKITITCLCASLLTSVATAQDKPWERDWTDDGPADGNEWLPVASGANGSRYFIRISDLINSTNQKPRVWIKTDHSKNKTVEYRTMMALITFDCVGETYTTLSQTSHMPDGSIGRNWKGRQTDYIEPDSVAEIWASRVCPKKD